MFELMSAPQIFALSPVFSVHPQGGSFSVALPGMRQLVAVCSRLARSRDFAGLYIPESTEPAFNSDSAQYGRVAALVRVLPMPPGLTVRDFPSGCLKYGGDQLVDRWPVGWPAEVVFFSPRGGPVLRDAVSAALGVHRFKPWAGQFLQGPIDLRPMPALRRRLMAEVLHQIAQDPATQLRPF